MTAPARLTFVVPWYGPDAPGGSEALARRTCEQLCQAGLPVEVLTTCARDVYSDWGHDHLPPRPRYRERRTGLSLSRAPKS